VSGLRVTTFVGARPNLPKAWTLQRALRGIDGDIDCRTVHTGQHFTPALSTEMADELGLRIDTYYSTPRADTDAQQLGRLMRCVEAELDSWPAECVIVMGDVNTTLAAALVAARAGIPVIHLEAGLRSRDGCPEEINRRAISSLASWHLCPTQRAVRNLLSEGTPREGVDFVGNSMIECLLSHRPRMAPTRSLERHGVTAGEYAIATTHKPLMLCMPEVLAEMLGEVADFVPKVLFACHPHTYDVLHARDVLRSLPENLVLLPPVGYLEFAALVEHAAVVVTDSDGLQEECCATSTPCCIMSDHTARPESIEVGAGTLVGVSPPRLRRALRRTDRAAVPVMPERWDLRVSERIRDSLLSFCASLGVTETSRRRCPGNPMVTPRTAVGLVSKGDPAVKLR
jgi:UDP-N-acetylglucosamine 2-epimerase (non-hydrolysing)